jgi:hypothetical protein
LSYSEKDSHSTKKVVGIMVGIKPGNAYIGLFERL